MKINRMMVQMRRALEILFGRGLYEFGYLVRKILRELRRRTPEARYKYYRRHFEQVERPLPFATDIKIGILTWEEVRPGGQDDPFPEGVIDLRLTRGQTVADVIGELDWDYVGFSGECDSFKADLGIRVANAVAMRKRMGLDTQLITYDREEIQYDEAQGFAKRVPRFFAGYAPDRLLNEDYVGSGFFISRDLLGKVLGQAEGMGEFFTYQMLLAAMPHLRSDNVCHLPHVMKRQEEPEPYTDTERERIQALKEELLSGNGFDVHVTSIDGEPDASHVYYVPERLPLVSIIIPSKDNPELLDTCISGIEKNTIHTPYEIIVVDNGGSLESRRSYGEIFQRHGSVKIRYYYEPMVFNFSKMCNLGVEKAEGELYLFLNDDVEVTDQPDFCGMDWLGVLAGQALQPRTGAVGVKLYYPNSTLLQHVGIINYESGAAHVHSKAEERRVKDYHARIDGNYLSVTGACMMIAREKFHQVGGFCEELEVTFNDVELCMKLYEKGYHNVVRKDVALYHHESITRGEDVMDREKYLRHLGERERLFDLHEKLVKRDPYYSIRLNQNRKDCSISLYGYLEERSAEKKADNLELLSELETMGKIHSALLHDGCLQVRGYCYKIKDRANARFQPLVYVDVNGKRRYFKTTRLFEPTLSKYLQSEQNVDFSSFYANVHLEDLDEDGRFLPTKVGIALCDGRGRLYVTDCVKETKMEWEG